MKVRGMEGDHKNIPKRDIIVIGTSAGGVEALQSVVYNLPKTLAASIFIVMHMPASRHSDLPEILKWHSRLPVHNPGLSEPIEPGQIYVAPPDYHLLIERDHRVSLWHGPKENNFRPAINPLFRSAADVFADRVVGVILSGTLDDGVAGLAWVKRHNGITVVQDPEDAKFPGLPQAALRYVEPDYKVPVSSLAGLLVDLANGSKPAATERRS